MQGSCLATTPGLCAAHNIPLPSANGISL